MTTTEMTTETTTAPTTTRPTEPTGPTGPTASGGTDRRPSRTEWPLAGCAVVFLALYTVNVLGQPRGGAGLLVSGLLTALYVPFLIDYVLRLVRAERRWHWFFTHPLDLAVVTLPFLQPLRFLRLVALVRALQRAFGDAVRGRVIAYAAFGCVLLLYVSSLAVLNAERYAPGSHITDYYDALWWSISTLSTVGYGDVVPVTVTGRILAVLLMLGGISLVGVVTATVAQWIVTEVAKDDSARQAATVAHIETLQDEITRLRQLVEDRAPTIRT